MNQSKFEKTNNLKIRNLCHYYILHCIQELAGYLCPMRLIIIIWNIGVHKDINRDRVQEGKNPKFEKLSIISSPTNFVLQDFRAAIRVSTICDLILPYNAQPTAEKICPKMPELRAKFLHGNWTKLGKVELEFCIFQSKNNRLFDRFNHLKSTAFVHQSDSNWREYVPPCDFLLSLKRRHIKLATFECLITSFDDDQFLLIKVLE